MASWLVQSAEQPVIKGRYFLWRQNAVAWTASQLVQITEPVIVGDSSEDSVVVQTASQLVQCADYRACDQR